MARICVTRVVVNRNGKLAVQRSHICEDNIEAYITATDCGYFKWIAVMCAFVKFQFS